MANSITVLPNPIHADQSSDPWFEILPIIPLSAIFHEELLCTYPSPTKIHLNIKADTCNSRSHNLLAPPHRTTPRNLPQALSSAQILASPTATRISRPRASLTQPLSGRRYAALIPPTYQRLALHLSRPLPLIHRLCISLAGRSPIGSGAAQKACPIRLNNVNLCRDDRLLD